MSGVVTVAADIGHISIEVVENAQSISAPAVQGAEEMKLSALAETLGEFRIVRLLGKGAMGAVYLAEHRIIGSKVALKVLKPELASKPELVQQFYDEARAVNRIGHPGIVRIFDLKHVGDSYALVMEHLEGRPLSGLVGTGVAPGTAVSLLAQVCDALDAAHRVGVVHRDVKPDNLFVIRRGRRDVVKLLDFGGARLQPRHDEAQPKKRGLIIGTPAYMAPEQWKGAMDPRSDLYSLGVVAYLLTTGRTPFPTRGKSIGEVFKMHRDLLPSDPRQFEPRIPEALAAVILRALEKNPEHRFQTAADMALALRRVNAAGVKKAPKRNRPVEPMTASAIYQTTISSLPAVNEQSTDSGFSVSGGIWSASYQACASATVPGILAVPFETGD